MIFYRERKSDMWLFRRKGENQFEKNPLNHRHIDTMSALMWGKKERTHRQTNMHAIRTRRDIWTIIIGWQYLHYPEQTQYYYVFPVTNTLWYKVPTISNRRRISNWWTNDKFTTEPVLSSTVICILGSWHGQWLAHVRRPPALYTNRLELVIIFAHMVELCVLSVSPFDQWRQSGTPHSAKWSLQCQYSSSFYALRAKQKSQ